MGKNRHSKDRLYITQTEHKYLYGGKKEEIRKAYKRLPFDCCSISLTPFKNAVCTREGNVFDIEAAVPFVKKHKINPVNGKPMTLKDLIKLNFSKNSEGKYFCPVTYKVFTDNSRIAAIATTGNVYAYDAIEELNIKSKNWTDLISGKKFIRKDIIVLQDPQDLTNREISNFEHLRRAKKLENEDASISNTIRTNGATNRILEEMEAKKAIKRKRDEDVEQGAKMTEKELYLKKLTHTNKASHAIEKSDSNGKIKYSKFTDGRCSTSFTSSVFNPVTKNSAAIASDKEVLEFRWAAVKKMKKKGYVRLVTTLGDINLELDCDFVPQTCDNFLSLSEDGYYNGTIFHRIIPGFMMQGGDPTGTGRGGESKWKKVFADEPDSRLNHTDRGILSMANSGPNTNGSQFFLTFDSCQHLDYKHTIFGRCVGGLETLDAVEKVTTDGSDRPYDDIRIEKVEVFQNPFAEYEQMESAPEKVAIQQKEVEEEDNDNQGTVVKVGNQWIACDKSMPAVTIPKAKGTGVAKYLDLSNKKTKSISKVRVDEDDEGGKEKKKKMKSSFSNFSSW